ncbi:MAG: peptidoglycan DD-metalloendopeptidase family protein [Nitrospinota bacterium]
MAVLGAAGALPPGHSLAAPGGAGGALAGVEREIRRREERLRSMEQVLAEERDREAQRRRRAESLLETLDAAAAQLAAEDERLRLLEQQLRRSEIRLAEVEGRARALRTEREALKRRLEERLRELYMGGPAATLRLLVMSRSVEDILDRWSLAALVSRHDARLMESFRKSGEWLALVQAEVQKEVDERAALLARQAEAKKRLVVLYNNRSRQLVELENDKGKRERLMEELELSRDALRDSIASLLTARPLPEGERGGRLVEGGLPWPVDGLPAAPGPGEGGGRSLRIRAVAGAPVRPVASGEVVFADWVRGYGHLLVLRHAGEMYTVYGGAGDVFVDKGEKVDASQMIARVGTTEALGGAALYFEIRKGSIPLDPVRWLSPRR